LTVSASAAAWCLGFAVLGARAWRAREAVLSSRDRDQRAHLRPLRSLPEATDLENLIAGTLTTDTDYWVLYGQLGAGNGRPAPRGPVQEPPDYQVGDVHSFWMGEEGRQRYWRVRAELRVKTPAVYLYVTERRAFDDATLSDAVALVEDRILPEVHRWFGVEGKPGIDADPRITILVTNAVPAGIAGYFSPTDEYPRAVKPYSNEREMIYVTSSYLADLDQFGQLLTHELQHMVHWSRDLSEATWVNEGLSLIAESVSGYDCVPGLLQFRRDPDVALTNWAADPADRIRNYAASKLFMEYLTEHYGGLDLVANLIAEESDGIPGVNQVLKAQGYDQEFVEVFSDWVVANLVNDAGVAQRQYAYEAHGGWEPAFSATLEPGDEVQGWVNQFGADYIELGARANRVVAFAGSGSVGVTSADPFSGESCWWSNRRNMLSSSITRQVDLTEVDRATLRFRTWYDTEEHFDHGYVVVSTNNGRTWSTLRGRHTTSRDPHRVSFGHAYTGQSTSWLEEEISLDEYAGQRILLRFWYITDERLSQPGWLIDDISIPQIGFHDGGERSNGRWVVDGFIRSTNELPQRFVVRLVEFGDETTIRDVPLDVRNRGEICLGDGTQRAVLIVCGVTPWTSELAPYHVALRDSPDTPPQGVPDAK
jgi:hypothetical protein